MGLSAYNPQAAAVAAARVMLERLRHLGELRQDFAFETTLAGRGHRRWLQELRRQGYRSHLLFLALTGADLAVERVAGRVRRGGHAVPDDVVRRRFRSGLVNLFSCYMDVVDGWHLYDNSDLAGPRVIATGSGSFPTIADLPTWTRLKELAR
jgi:predicted ABC-type ATPase